MEVNLYLKEKLKLLLDFYPTVKKVMGISPLTDPMDYFIHVGGKRIRPIMVLGCFELFDSIDDHVLNAAWAIELLHNFTLIHDDIMDDAPSRRGKTTLHELHGTNNAILFGDSMLIVAYKLLANSQIKYFSKLLNEFSQTALDVCEGQIEDLAYEKRTDVGFDEYIHMIKLKTSVLVAFSCKMGGIMANQHSEITDLLYDFGLNLGLSFQLLDDHLDIYGDSSKVGKKVGGDILMHKKTAHYTKALEVLSGNQKEYFIELYHSNHTKKLDEVLKIYSEYQIELLVKNEIKKYSDLSLEALKLLNDKGFDTSNLKAMSELLLNRNY